MAEQINLEGTNWISDIPGVYFDATSQLVEKVGGEANVGKYIGRIGLGTGTVIDLTVNIAQDPDNPGKIIASTIVADGTVYVLGGYFANVLITDVLIGTALAITGVATAPVWLTVASVGVAVAATTYFGSDLKNWIYNDLKNSLSDFEEYGFHSPEIVGTITKDKFISQSATNDPDFCKNIFPDYVNYRQITEIKSGTESFLYNQLTKDATVQTASQNEKDAAEVIFKNTDADKLTLNNQTFDIRNLSSIQLRNAIDGIDKVSFLLSNITIKVGEKIDIGNGGVYTVKSGDTLSVIAQNNGYVTKDLVKLNPWLFDDNRIQFNYPTKVLVAEGTVISDNANHTIYGDANAENILIDHNGGDDKLYGGSKNDHIEGGNGNDTLSGGAGHDVLFGGNDSDVLYGGEGQDTLVGGDNDNASDALFGGSGEDVLLGGGGDDTLAGGDASNLYADKVSDYLAGGVGHDIYYVSHQDIINDADSTGFIMFNDKSLSGTKTKVDEYTYEDANFTYTLNGPNMIVVDKNLGEYITIENMNFNNASGMGMEFDDGSETDPNKKDIEIYVGDATVTEGGTLEFTIGIDNTLDEDLVVNVSSYFNGSANSSDIEGATSGTITIKAGTTYGTFEIGTLDDTIVEPTENFIFAVTGLAAAYGGTDMNSYLIKNAGEGTIVDNDKKTDKEIAISIGSGSRYEGGGEIAFTVSISEALDEEISIGYQATSEGNSLVAGYYNVVIAAGKTSAELVVAIVDDEIPEENEAILLSYVGFGYNGADIASATGSNGSGSILDDDEDGDGHPMDPAPIEPPRCEPLVLDMDKDGFISTVSLEESTAYFDLTGDGIKEKVGWLQANDGLVAYDKSGNGKIDGIDEVFGNQTVYGFDELRETADSNYDGIIDRRDELYNQLKIWQDTNQDGTSQADELKSLSEAGVRSINLSAVGTNIELNGNIIVEASKYTDSEGNLELAADIEFTFDSRITKIDTLTIPDYTEHPDSSTLPNLRGYGIVSDSYITYNIDENFRTLALEFGSDVTKVANEFESFMDGWSGYTKMQTDLQMKYGLDTPPKLSDLDRKVWTYEHFMGTGSFSAGIEQRLETTAKAMQSGGSDTASAGRYNDAVVNSVYNNGSIYSNKITPHVSQNYTLLFNINLFQQDVLSQSLKKDIINNSFFIFKNTLHVEDIKNRNLLKEVA